MNACFIIDILVKSSFPFPLLAAQNKQKSTLCPKNFKIIMINKIFLFGYFKERWNSHPDTKSLIKQITRIVNSFPKEKYKKTFQKWI